jgi:hypothetical protein
MRNMVFGLSVTVKKSVKRKKGNGKIPACWKDGVKVFFRILWLSNQQKRLYVRNFKYLIANIPGL